MDRKPWQIEEQRRLRTDLQTKTYEKEGHLYWKSNDAPVPMDVFLRAEVPPPPGQEAAVEAHTKAFLEEYRKRMENYQPSDEELFEMRAAFGPGAEVVNVITGKKIKLPR